jgi:hypothetical protein
MFEGICEAIHKEMDALDDKYSKGTQLSGQDLEHIDLMAHALKSIKGYETMLGYSERDGGSYARGRSRTTGRYISRDDGYEPHDGYRRY